MIFLICILFVSVADSLRFNSNIDQPIPDVPTPISDTDSSVSTENPTLDNTIVQTKDESTDPLSPPPIASENQPDTTPASLSIANKATAGRA